MRRLVQGIAIATICMAVGAPTGWGASRHHHRTSKAKHHHRRHRPHPEPRPRPSPPAPSDTATVNTLRFSDSTTQLDALFASLPAGAMPGHVTARGWVRCRISGCEGQQANAMLNGPFVPLAWMGQEWSTDANGGTYTNRTLGDSRRDFPAIVSYGSAFLDGKRAIVATYPSATNPPPVDDLVLNFRMVQRGVYLGYVYLEVPRTPPVLLFNVIEDTLRSR